jgi:ubiquinone/menaquinone biosynthesis C-methylase UbiE
MGYVFNFKDSINYQKWIEAEENSLALMKLDSLLFSLLKPVNGNSILDIGCGTGRNLLSFIETGLDTTGIDPSVYMNDIASNAVENRAKIYNGFGEDLPFDDNSFNYSSIILTLEFAENYKKMLEEAARVTKDKVVIIFLNKYAIKSIERRIKSLFSSSIYNKAKFFSIWELKQIMKNMLGDVPTKWETALQLPGQNKTMQKIDALPFAQKSPIGTFAGLSVILKPRFRTTPLRLKVKTGSRVFSGAT